MFTRHDLRSLSFALLILVGCAGLTAFGATRRADATANSVPGAQRATSLPTLQLIRPEDNACSTGVVTFTWLWKGTPLAGNQGFEVRLWKENMAQHVRLATPASSKTQRVDLRRAPVVRQGGTGRYLWSVVAVQLTPYRQIGKETSPRRLYIDLTKPANVPCIVLGSPTNTPDVQGSTTNTRQDIEVGREPESSVSPEVIRILVLPEWPTSMITETLPPEPTATDVPINESTAIP